MAMEAPTSSMQELALPSAATALAALAEPIRAWFCQHFAGPTPTQRLAWPAVAAGDHLLVAAPTGTGKTLAAFLPILSEMLTRHIASSISCLYIAPLKALSNDVRKSLRTTLRKLRPYLSEDVRLRVEVRTGDTSPAARQRFRHAPPDILLTTPESLAVLLSQPYAAELWGTLRWVIVDEVHALASNKRGADLAISLERLTCLAGSGLQRIGLSATCQPLSEAAQFLVGVDRPCAVAAVADDNPLQLRVEPLESEASFFQTLLSRLEPEIHAHHSSLIFTNTRSLAERLSWALRRRFTEWRHQIAIHHSAIAAAQRRRVERALKQGRLRVVVSSTSLELGIDIGSVEQVILVHPPGDVVRLLQRVGRAGHAPGLPRRGLILAGGATELLDATVTAASGRAGQYEPLQAAAQPLDVLCQQILGMAAAGWWTTEEAWSLVRRSYPYRNLSHEDFEDCLHYLSGRHRDGREWLPSRLRWQGDTFHVLDERTARLLRQNIGTILAEEFRWVRFRAGGTIGQVDEAFAERLQPGDRFLLDGRCLEYLTTEQQMLLVDEVPGRPAVPRWHSQGWPLSAALARRLYVLRMQAAEALRDGAASLAELLRRDYELTEPAITCLVDYFGRQESLSEIPDTCTLLIESVLRETSVEYYLHTPLNRTGNDALARVLMSRLVHSEGRAGLSYVGDLGLALILRGAVEVVPDVWRRILAVENFDTDLNEALARGSAVRQRFQRVAFTGLMLLRRPLGRRRRVGGRDWGQRRLFAQVQAADPHFVLLRQAHREVRAEMCDAHAAREFLEQLPSWSLHTRWLSSPSPFARTWTQIGAGPAAGLENPADEWLRRDAVPDNRPVFHNS